MNALNSSDTWDMSPLYMWIRSFEESDDENVMNCGFLMSSYTGSPFSIEKREKPFARKTSSRIPIPSTFRNCEYTTDFLSLSVSFSRIAENFGDLLTRPSPFRRLGSAASESIVPRSISSYVGSESSPSPSFASGVSISFIIARYVLGKILLIFEVLSKAKLLTARENARNTPEDIWSSLARRCSCSFISSLISTVRCSM